MANRIPDPTSGTRIGYENNKIVVPDDPIIPYIEGDGTGPDIWRATKYVVEGAVEKVYGGKRKIHWHEVFAGDKAFAKFGEYLPQETLDHLAHYRVPIKGPLSTPVGGGIRSLNVSLRQVLDLFACVRPVRYFDGVPSPVRVPQKVDTFQVAVDPVSIVMALDSSGSMKKATETVKSTAIDFVREVRPEDNLALITFADRPTFAHVLATERQWTIDAINKYQAIGGTALYDAVWNSLLTLKGVAGHRVVVVLTDGRDENNPGTAPGSKHTLDEVLELMKEVGATVYGVGLGATVDRPVLETLARDSGGQAYFASDASSLGDQFRRVVESLRRRYVLGYTSTNSTHDGAWRTVEIRPRDPNYVVRTAGGYFAPAE